MKRRQFLEMSDLAGAAVLAGRFIPKAPQAKQPNILFMMACDLKLAPDKPPGHDTPEQAALRKEWKGNLTRMTAEERAAFEAAYRTDNEAFRKAQLRGRALAESKYEVSGLASSMFKCSSKAGAEFTASASAVAPTGQSIAPAAPAVSSAARPALPPDVPQFFIPARGSAPPDCRMLYHPVICGAAKVNFADAKTGVDLTQDAIFQTQVTEEAVPVNWDNARPVEIAISDLERTPRDGAHFAEVSSAATKTKNYAAWSKDFVSWLYGTHATSA